MQTKQEVVTMARAVQLGIACTVWVCYWFTSSYLRMMSLTNGYRWRVDMEQQNRERPCSGQLMSGWPQRRKSLISRFLLWSTGRAAQWGMLCPLGYKWCISVSSDTFRNSQRLICFMRKTWTDALTRWPPRLKGFQLSSLSVWALGRHLVLKTNELSHHTMLDILTS